MTRATEQTVVAVVGTGSIGTRHLETLAGIEGVTGVAVPVRSERLSELRAAGRRAVARLEESGARAAIIATDTARHLDDALAALRLGCDVLVEKPLCVDAEQARRLVKTARAASRQLFVGCVLRFADSLNAFRHRLPELGTLHAVRIECQSFLPDWRAGRRYQDSYSSREAEGGVLRDLIHEIDYAGWFFGWPNAVAARARNLGRLGIDADELVELSWELPRGGVLSIGLDYLSRPPRRRMRAAGERGTLEWDGRAGVVTLMPADGTVNEVRFSQSREEMFAAQARAFLASMTGIIDERLAGGEDGVRALAVCDAARRASINRREEPVAYDGRNEF